MFKCVLILFENDFYVEFYRRIDENDCKGVAGARPSSAFQHSCMAAQPFMHWKAPCLSISAALTSK